MAKRSSLELAHQTIGIVPFVMRFMAAQLRNSKYGALAGHVSILGMLALRSYTMKELAEVHMVSSPTMSSTISTLEERGWLKRERGAEDRRMVWVTITADGQAALDDMMAQTAEKIGALLDSLSEDEQALLGGGLKLLLGVFKDSFHDE
jgi:DNA-binding MarR family transcriptional regulator